MTLGNKMEPRTPTMPGVLFDALVDHLFDTMVEAHYVRDKGTAPNQWL